MKRLVILMVVVFLCSPLMAQIWVEHDPGHCTVGPPPICVSGHWYYVELPKLQTSTFRPQGEESRERQLIKPAELSTDLEYESFSYDGDFYDVNGSSIGLKAAYERMTSSTFSYGARLLYEKGNIKDSDYSPYFFAGHVFAKKWLGELIFVSGGFSYSSYKGGDDIDPLSSLGPVVSVGLEYYVGSVLIGGGVSYQYSKISFEEAKGYDFFENGRSNLSFGLNGGYELGESMFIAAEFYKLTGLSVIGTTLSYFVSETFALTLGYKTILGLEQFTNHKITLGSSVRF